MPHTSHRKKKGTQNKRQEILYEDGWTRVTSHAHHSSRPLAHENDHILDADRHHSIDNPPPVTVPLPPVEGSTPESIQAQFSKVEERWLATELCKTLEHALTSRILATGPKISSCVVLGTGSFCGDAVHWIDRHESAYFQLAAFKTVVRVIERVQGLPVPAYAQEPLYNDLDTALLESLNVTKVEHPRGFELSDEHSCVYSPAAELEVESQIMARNPQVWLHRAFDHLNRDDTGANESEKQSGKFQKTHRHLQLPALDLKNFPFHGSVIWWRNQDDHEEMPSSTST